LSQGREDDLTSPGYKVTFTPAQGDSLGWKLAMLRRLGPDGAFRADVVVLLRKILERIESAQ